jgi:hypothetical protein
MYSTLMGLNGEYEMPRWHTMNCNAVIAGHKPHEHIRK